MDDPNEIADFAFREPEIRDNKEERNDRIRRGPPLFSYIVFDIALLMCAVTGYLIRHGPPLVNADLLSQKAAQLQAWLLLEYYAAIGFITAAVVGNICLHLRWRLGIFFGWITVICVSFSAIATLGTVANLGEINRSVPENSFWYGFALRLAFGVLYAIAVASFADWLKKLSKLECDSAQQRKQQPVFCMGMFIVAILMSLLSCFLLAHIAFTGKELELPPELVHIKDWLTVDYYFGWAFGLIGIVGNVLLLSSQRNGFYFGWLMFLCAVVSALIAMTVWLEIRNLVPVGFSLGFLFGFGWRVAFLVLYPFALVEFSRWYERMTESEADVSHVVELDSWQMIVDDLSD